MFKLTDYIIISVICFLLGIFLMSQYFAGKNYKKIIQPENSAVLALEVAKLTKTNADLRQEVQSLTKDLDSYRNSADAKQLAYDQYVSDADKFNLINGNQPIEGQGIVIQINGKMSTPEIVDLINAIKNSGAGIMSLNNVRLVINSNMDQFANRNSYEVKVLGNSKLLKSALERKGGIVEQIAGKDIKFNIVESDKVSIPSNTPIKFIYSKIISD